MIHLLEELGRWRGEQPGDSPLGRWMKSVWPPRNWWCTCCKAKGILWSGNVAPAKLFQESGLFTSTIKTSQDIHLSDTQPQGISWNGTNVPWEGNVNHKFFIQSGVFSGTVKTSQTITSCQAGISWDATNAAGTKSTNKLILVSGHFTSTIKTSQAVGTHAAPPTGISYDGTNTPWSGQGASVGDWLWLTSGQFTSTIKTSQRTDTISTLTASGGIGDQTPNTLFAAQTESGGTKGKLFQMSGKFSSTIKTSLQAPVNRIYDLADQAFTTG